MDVTEKGISRLCMIPVMQQASYASMPVTQMLFGEHYEILEKDTSQQWLKVRMYFDTTEGWINASQHYSISQEYFDQINNSDYKICTDITANIFFKKHYLNILIGSILPISTNELFKMEEQLAFNGNSKSLGQRRDFQFLR